MPQRQPHRKRVKHYDEPGAPLLPKIHGVPTGLLIK